MSKIQYDPEAKILSIRISEARSVDSEVQNNVVLDYDKNGNLVNIDVMGVNLGDLLHSPNEQMKYVKI